MKALLYKQFRLVAHPTTYMFCLFGAMLLIPNYPYTVSFFYVTLGLFFTFQNGREQRDSDFSALLPVRKCDTVRVSILFAVIMETVNILLSVPHVVLSSIIRPNGGNEAGIDANVAVLGLGFIVFAVFNLVFFSSFFRTGYKVGSSFLKASVCVFLVVILDVVAPHIVSWLDGYDARQWIVLLVGVALFVILSLISCKISVSRYEKVDL